MNSVFTQLVKYVLMAALRDRLALSLLLLVIVAASLSVFLGSAAVTETDQFALVFAAGGLRITGVAALVIFISFHMRRAFESKDVDFLLSRPISRRKFLLAHSCAFSILAVFTAALITGALLVVSRPLSVEGFSLWAASIVAELIIMANASLFFAMVIRSAAGSTLAVFALYALARLIGQIFGIIDGHGAARAFGTPWLNEAMSYLMQVISLIVPRIDLMGQTSWLIYGPVDGVGYGFILLQCVVYSALLVAAALVDLARRQF